MSASIIAALMEVRRFTARLFQTTVTTFFLLTLVALAAVSTIRRRFAPA